MQLQRCPIREHVPPCRVLFDRGNQFVPDKGIPIQGEVRSRKRHQTKISRPANVVILQPKERASRFVERGDIPAIPGLVELFQERDLKEFLLGEILFLRGDVQRLSRERCAAGVGRGRILPLIGRPEPVHYLRIVHAVPRAFLEL